MRTGQRVQRTVFRGSGWGIQTPFLSQTGSLMYNTPAKNSLLGGANCPTDCCVFFFAVFGAAAAGRQARFEFPCHQKQQLHTSRSQAGCDFPLPSSTKNTTTENAQDDRGACQPKKKATVPGAPEALLDVCRGPGPPGPARAAEAPAAAFHWSAARLAVALPLYPLPLNHMHKPPPP